MQDRHAFFASLVTGYSAELYRFAFWLCRDRGIAEDLVQETFARSWKSIDQLRDMAAAKAWLFSTLRNENARRFERIQPEYDDADLEQVAGDYNGIDDRPEAFALRTAIRKLPEEYREPLLLQVLGGFSGEDIAAMIGIKANAVMVRIHRARNMVRRQLLGTDDAGNEAQQ